MPLNVWRNLTCVMWKRVFSTVFPGIDRSLRQYSRVIFVDAGVQVPEVQLFPVRIIPTNVSIAISHVLIPWLVIRTSELLYGFKPDLFVCTILGEDFAPGTGLTKETQRRADRAVMEILRMLTSFSVPLRRATDCPGRLGLKSTG